MGIFSKYFNKKDESKAEVIRRKTIDQQLTRFGMELENWKTGINNWEDVDHPTTEELIRVYNDVVLDPHLSAVLDVRKSKTLSKEYKVVDDNGDEIYEETEIFNSTWFRDFLKIALDSKFFGYSLIQFKDRIGKSFIGVESVSREYVYPQKNAVRVFPGSNEPLIFMNQPKYKPWTFLVGTGKELGLLAKASPMMIYKKTAQGAWAEFTELFGSPIRIGKTNVRDKALRENMYYMLENMGRSAFAVLDENDTIELVSDKKQDAFLVFDKLIERANSEISKLITGSTMTVDEGSSRSQSEVHERTAQAIDKDDSIFLQELVNNRLIPFLNEYHDFNIKGVWMWDDVEKLSRIDQFNRDIELIKTGKYKIPNEYITETYGIPLDEMEGEKPDPQDPDKDPTKLNNSLKKKAHLLESEFFCDVCNNIDSSDLPPIEWDSLTVDDVINGVFSGKYTVENLPESVYFRIARELTKGMDSGLDAVGAFADTTDGAFRNALRDNAFKFSGAKTFQQVREMSDFIYDNSGTRVNFGEYEAKAREIFDTYNKEWLRTEVAQASNSAQMASKWQKIEEDKEDLPYLRYDTVGDQRVRDDHKALDGIIRPISDPFWETYYPPNGWNCRCTVLQEDDSAELTLLDINKLPELPKSMDINVGKRKLLFSPEHPYFIVEDQFKELASNNFGLPMPVEAVKLPDWSRSTPKQIKDFLLKEFNSNGFNAESVRIKTTADKTALSQQVNQLSKLLNEYNVSPEWDKKSPFKVSFMSGKGFHGQLKYKYGEARGGALRYADLNLGHRVDDINQRISDNARIDTSKITSKSKVDDINLNIATTTHEFAHFMAVSDFSRVANISDKTKTFFKELSEIRQKYQQEVSKYYKAGENDKVLNISLGKYANTNIDEFFAESFTEYKLKTNPSKYAKEVGLLTDKYFKK